MMRIPIKKLQRYYKPLLVALFEYYLYESYPSERIRNMEESVLPFSAITAFYADFASGESARLNRTTLYETINGVIGVDVSKLLAQAAETDPAPRSLSPLKKKLFKKIEEHSTKDLKGVVFTFYDFIEIVFEISQEINVNRNESVAQKYKDYIEEVILLNIKYRLPMNDLCLHKKRLSAELERIRSSNSIRTGAKASKNADEPFDLL